MSKPRGEDLALAGSKFLGRSYGEMDCQKFVENCLAQVGIRKDLPGSNAWYRLVMQQGWVGTPEECKKIYGCIPTGAFLFILEQDGREPAKYQGDGIGNASHIGIYTGKTAIQMISHAVGVGNTIADATVDFGNGAIHSSSSRGRVVTSNFSGKSIKGGWNRVGLWLSQIDYSVNDNQGEVVMRMATVRGGNENAPINMRAARSTSAVLLEKIPQGTEVEVLEIGGTWTRIKYNGETGYVMTKFIQTADEGNEVRGFPATNEITISRAELEKAYDIIGDLLGMRG